MGIPIRPPAVDKEVLRKKLQEADAKNPISDELPDFETKSASAKPIRRSVKKIVEPDPEPEENNTEDNWVIDPKTGKKYKKFAVASKDALTANKKNKGGGLTLDQARKFVELDEDFDLDDLNGSAETFLAHLRVPPDKEEQKRLLEERKKRRGAQELAYKKAQEYLDEIEERKIEGRKK